MTNSVEVILDAIDAAARSLPHDPTVASVEQLLVQLEQVAARLQAHVPDADNSHLMATRSALASGDPALAALELGDALSTLRRSQQ